MNYGSGGVQRNTVKDFWNKVDIQGENDCWNWKEGTWHNGYGRFKWNYQSWRAHRFALLAVNRLPNESTEVVRHKCHNRLCCNPNHLLYGTQKENVSDRWDRVRLEASWGHESASPVLPRE